MSQTKLKISSTLLISAVIWSSLFYLFSPTINAAARENNLDKYSQSFYDRYSSHFDVNGLSYSIPSYGIKNFQTPITAREWISLASYYKYRAQNGEDNARQILNQAIIKAVAAIKNKPAEAQSFNDAEAFFLIIRMIESVPELLTSTEKTSIIDLIAANIESGISAKDTENRAIVAGAHWQYLNNYLHQQTKINNAQKKYFDKLIKNKIDQAIKQSIYAPEGWYFENNKKTFSAHYHAVSAFMLLMYGDLTQQNRYLELAQKMYFNGKKLAFINGMTEAKIGNRPIGLGAQFYLMMALLGEYFNDDDYRVYLFYGSGDRFFSDKKYPDRLEYHSTIEFSPPNYHDDYAFSDVVELGLTVEKLRTLPIDYQYFFRQPIAKSQDKYFTITNLGKVIVINNQKNLLGSWGNWSHLYKIK